MCRHKNEGSFSQEKGVYRPPIYIFFNDQPYYYSTFGFDFSLKCAIFLLLLLQYSLCSSLSLSLSSQETRNRKKWRKLLRLKKAITGLIKDQGLLHFGDNSYIYIYFFFCTIFEVFQTPCTHFCLMCVCVCVCTRRGSYKMIFKVGVLCEVDISKCHIKSKTWAEK